MPKDNLAIQASNLFFTRSGENLLKNISFQVSYGKHLVLLGPNGSGKTLILKLLTGYLWPTSGTITILGHQLGKVDLRVLRQQIGWVAKSLEEMTPSECPVMDVILSGRHASLGLYVEPSPSDIEEAIKLANKLKINKILKRPFGLLSSGEKQRVLLARAVLPNPKILILDEPMSNLDMGGRELFMSNIQDLAQASNCPTIILTTHNSLEIAPFFTQAMIIKDGEAIANGQIDSIITDYNLSKAFELPLKVEKTKQGRYLVYI